MWDSGIFGGVLISLTYITLLCEAIIPSIDFTPELTKYNWPPNIRDAFTKTKYYKGLAAYCQLFKPKKVLELGTCSGASAVALSKYDGHVDTYDIHNKLVDIRINNNSISINLLEQPADILSITYTPYDLIFVDLDHQGWLEEEIHKKLLLEYNGIEFYDDVQKNDMVNFWWNINNDKMILNWNVFGFGIVRYGQI